MSAGGLLGLYHRLPYPLRVAVASARGWQLRRQRYPAGTDAAVEAALERERWSPARWEHLQTERLQRTLHRARHHVPHHRALWDERTRTGDPRRWDRLEDWPVLAKAPIRAHAASFLADGADRRRLVEEHTSGSTGTPMTVWHTRHAVHEWYAVCDARLHRWYGVSRHDRWAILGGQLVVRPGAADPPWWVWNQGQRQLYLSALDVSPRTAPAYARAMRRHRVAYLHGYPSAMHALAVGIEASGATAAPLSVVVSNAEPLLAHQRDAIERVFDCPVRDTYGMSETVAGASECPHGTLHLWPEIGLVEVLDDEDRPVPPGTVGRLVCTGLLDEDMPFVRYEVGDRGALGPPGCPCGRTLPVLASVEGRLDDVVVTADGRLVGRLDHVFKADLPVLEAQIVQHAVGDFEVVVVPAPGWGPEAARSLAERLVERVGPAGVRTTEVVSIPRGANGKLRAVVSHVHARAGDVP